MGGGRAIAATAGALLGLLVLAAAVSVGAQRAAPGGPGSIGEWAARAVRPPGPLPSGRGEALFSRYGCRLCHTLDGRGGLVGPTLNGVRDRKTRAEIIEWLDDPQKIKPGTIMPRFHLTPLEKQVLADHLLTR